MSFLADVTLNGKLTLESSISSTIELIVLGVVTGNGKFTFIISSSFSPNKTCSSYKLMCSMWEHCQINQQDCQSHRQYNRAPHQALLITGSVTLLKAACCLKWPVQVLCNISRTQLSVQYAYSQWFVLGIKGNWLCLEWLSERRGLRKLRII